MFQNVSRLLRATLTNRTCKGKRQSCPCT